MYWRYKVKLGSSLAALAALVTILGSGGLARAESGGSQVVATIGDRQITEAELNAKIAGQMASIQNQIYQVKKRGIDAIADDYAIEKAAKKANLSKDEYLKREADDKTPSPSDAEVQKVYDDNKAKIHQPLDKIKPQIVSFIRRQGIARNRQELLAKLRSENGLKVMLEPPRFQVSTDGTAAVGPKNAPVTVVEFSDFQCPFCRKVEDSLSEVRKKFADKVRLIYRDFPLPMHEHAAKAAEAARCAEEQGKFWPYHDVLFADQTKLDVAGLKASAAKLKLNTKQFDECLDHDKYADGIKKDSAEGAAVGVRGTPAFFINGRFLDGAQSAQSFEDVIREELDRQSQKQAAAR